MNIEHQMKMCFDDQYVKKYNEYSKYKKMLRGVQIDYLRGNIYEKLTMTVYICALSQIIFKTFLIGFIIAPITFYLMSSFVCIVMCLDKRIELDLNNKLSLCWLRLKSVLGVVR